MSPRQAFLIVLLGAIGATLGIISYHALEDQLHPKEQTFELINCNMQRTMDSATAQSPSVEYLQYKADGTVWARWPDGRFLEVTPK